MCTIVVLETTLPHVRHWQATGGVNTRAKAIGHLISCAVQLQADACATPIWRFLIKPVVDGDAETYWEGSK